MSWVKDPETILIEKQFWHKLEGYIDRCTPIRGGLALRWHFGIRCAPMTYKQIAWRFGVTATRVNQIVAKALRQIKGMVWREMHDARLAKPDPDLMQRWHEYWKNEWEARESAAKPKPPPEPKSKPDYSNPRQRAEQQMHEHLSRYHNYGFFLYTIPIPDG